MNSKIKTYLISKGIDFSVPFLVDENHLEKIDEKYIGYIVKLLKGE